MILKNPRGHLYFIRCAGLVKVGFTKHVQNRVKILQTQCPIPIELLVSVPGCKADEWKLHEVFYAAHSHGEWFHPILELTVLIDRLRATGTLPPELRGTTEAKHPLRSKYRPRNTPPHSAGEM